MEDDKMKFYICKHCGNIITKLTDSNVPVVCCGEPMSELTPNTTEAATEKHKPVIVERDGHRFATVGSTLHPMTPEHYIEWLVVEYEDHQRVYHFTPDDEPTVKLCRHHEPKEIYAYCNLHGLWKMDK